MFKESSDIAAKELKIDQITDLGDGLRLFTAPYVSLREPVYRISAGELIPSHLRTEYPETPGPCLLPYNRVSGARGFVDFKVSQKNDCLSMLVIAVEPEARGGRTFRQLLNAVEAHAESLGLSSIQGLDVLNEKLARVFPLLGYERVSSSPNTFHKKIAASFKEFHFEIIR